MRYLTRELSLRLYSFSLMAALLSNLRFPLAKASFTFTRRLVLYIESGTTVKHLLRFSDQIIDFFLRQKKFSWSLRVVVFCEAEDALG